MSSWVAQSMSFLGYHDIGLFAFWMLFTFTIAFVIYQLTSYQYVCYEFDNAQKNFSRKQRRNMDVDILHQALYFKYSVMWMLFWIIVALKAGSLLQYNDWWIQLFSAAGLYIFIGGIAVIRPQAIVERALLSRIEPKELNEKHASDHYSQLRVNDPKSTLWLNIEQNRAVWGSPKSQKNALQSEPFDWNQKVKLIPTLIETIVLVYIYIMLAS